MTGSVWLGGMYIKNEGGYEIVLKSLTHYKKRLQTLGQSPELQNAAAMFGPVLGQEARKTIPRIDDMLEKIRSILEGGVPPESLYHDVEFLDKALSCYRADIQKAQDTSHEYFAELVGDMQAAKADLATIKIAKDRLASDMHE